MDAPSPETYTHGHHDSVLRSHRWRTAENSVAYLLGELRPGARLLDVGCGPGTITAGLGARVSPGVVVGLDREPSVLAEAREASKAAGTAAAFGAGDAYRLPFPDRAFDVVHAHQVLHHLHEPVRALREWRRVCRPGGIVAVREADYAGFAWHPADPMLTRWLGVFHEVTRANGAEADAGRRLLAWAHAAGFSDVVPSASVWCFATPADRAWWGTSWAERCTESAFARQAVAGGVAGPGELASIAEAWRRWADAPDGWFAVLHGEILARA